LISGSQGQPIRRTRPLFSIYKRYDEATVYAKPDLDATQQLIPVEAEATEAPEVESGERTIPAVGENEEQGDVTPAVPEDCRPWTWVRRQGRLWKTPPSPRHRPLVDVPAEDSAEDLTPILAEASIETPPPKAPTDELALAPVEAPVLSTSPGTEDESGDEPVEEPETTQSIPCFGRGFSHAKPSLFGNAKAA